MLGLLLSALNLVGAFLALLALGGLGAWSGVQFVGFFGVLEASTGVAYLIGPNIWRLPVAEASTSDRTRIRLAASTVLVPRWAALAKVAAGLAMLGVAVAAVGVGPRSLLLLPLGLAIGLAVTGVSLVVARVGVAFPAWDVVFVVVQRPGQPDRRLPGISIGGMAVQLVLNIGAFPAVKVLSPSVLYRPEIAPNGPLFLSTASIAAACVVAAALAWRGRIAWHAPREQQREADEFG